MPNPQEDTLRAQLESRKLNMTLHQDAGFKVLHGLLASAFEAWDRDDVPLAQKLLNTALDVEHELTGDCAVLGDLAEAWGIDDETGRFVVPGYSDSEA